MSDQELRIIAPTAIVGYGFQESSLERALLKDPHLIACDAGSTDPGPNYLGMGKAFVGRDAAKRDLSLMLQAAVDRGIPMIIGTSGGAGGDEHLQWTREIVEEIASENNLHFPMALIHSEQTQDYVLRKAGRRSYRTAMAVAALGTGHGAQEHQHRGNGRYRALHRGPERRGPSGTVRAL